MNMCLCLILSACTLLLFIHMLACILMALHIYSSMLGCISLCMLPSHFDIRTNHTDCLAFKPFLSQGDCNACVAASLATLLSIQACLTRGTPNITYSGQRIWDCFDGLCTLGVMPPLMDTFFPYVLHGPQSANMFTQRPSVTEQITGSNFTRCAPLSSMDPPPLLSIDGHSSLHAGNQSHAATSLKTYLHNSKGPAMSIVRMTQSAFQAFIQPYSTSQLQQEAAFALGPPGHILHALTVLGWRDSDGAWLVQNSMGPAWQDQGIGWLLGPLEAEWYGFQLQKQPEPDSIFTAPLLPTRQRALQSDDQLDLIIFLLTCLSMGSLAWMLCFCVRYHH